MPEWATIRHPETNGVTVIPARALPGWLKRGWVEDNDNAPAQSEAFNENDPAGDKIPDPPKRTKRKSKENN